MKSAIPFISLLTIILLNWHSTPRQSSNANAPELKSGWKRVDAQGRFSFHLPETMQPQEVHGIDSYVGQYRNDRMQVLFDYGMYSNPLDTFFNSAEYREIKKQIGNLSAKIIFFRQTHSASGYKYFAAV